MDEKLKEVIATASEQVSDILPLLKSVEDSWQPTDFLPDSTSDRWFDEIKAVREMANGITDEVLVVLAGNMITEEALPTYQTWLNRFEGARDLTGADDTLWAKWTRWWAAEENRHGDLLNRYLYVTGRINMKAVEVTIQHLIRNGFDPQTNNHPYKGLIYTSFQERATRVSHGNTAQLAKRDGDMNLHKICTVIAGDEARHEKGYKEITGKIFKLDPQGCIIAFEQMMRKLIVMPATTIEDGSGPGLFERFATVAQRVGVYTAHDYADILKHLIDFWGIEKITGLSGDSAKSQEYLCTLAERYQKLADRAQERLARKSQSFEFSWIFNRSV